LGKNRSFITDLNRSSDADPHSTSTAFSRSAISGRVKRNSSWPHRDAHHRRLQLLKGHHRVHRVTLNLPDLGDEHRNKQLEAIVTEFAEKIALVLRES
jgi:hypothetical protein